MIAFTAYNIRISSTVILKLRLAEKHALADDLGRVISNTFYEKFLPANYEDSLDLALCHYCGALFTDDNHTHDNSSLAWRTRGLARFLELSRRVRRRSGDGMAFS